MKAIIKLWLVVLIIFSLSACVSIKTYDDLQNEYQIFVTERASVYQENIDYFNHISTESIKSVVLVKKIGTRISGSTSGSGVIFKEDTLYYYVLTNNHVVYQAPGTIANYTISDYLGNEYTAVRLANNPNFDLAVMRFRKGAHPLDIMAFATSNPEQNAKLAVMGYPSFQINAITLGSVIQYATIEVENTNTELINVNFDVMVSDAPVKSGSSGSVVINDAYQLVGIVYAGNFSNASDTSRYSFAIPLTKVLEFLELIGHPVGGTS